MSGGENPLFISHFAYIASELERRAKAGNRLSYIHFMEPRVTDVSAEDEGSKAYFDDTNDFVFSTWKGSVIRSGNLALYLEDVKDIVANARSLVAYARLFIANPDLVEKLEKGLPLNKHNRLTFYTMSREGLLDYPTYEEALK